MSAAHTPGPWTLRPSGHKWAIDTGKAPRSTVYCRDLATACQIAAAPKLLESCKAFLAACEEVKRVYGAVPAGMAVAAMSARAAIAKAEGRS